MFPSALLNAENDGVLRFLEGRSAHGDIVEPFTKANANRLETFISDPQNFGAVVWLSNGEILAFAEGMQFITVKLANVGSPSPLGPEWSCVVYDSKDWTSLIERLLERTRSA